MKKVTLSVVVFEDSEANHIARMMENSDIAQQGIYTIECGHVEELTIDEEEMIRMEVPAELLDEDEEESDD